MRMCLPIGLATLAVMVAGCIQVSIPGQDTLFVKGEPFVLRGVSAVVNSDGPCLVWYGDNGITYHLFQGINISSDDYDRIITPGVVARLELAVRTDLEVSCDIGTVVEVQSVLAFE